ncbi:LysR family transcriptional regulator [Arenimonas caeni]|jgi:DNA-binding transcriptional LysR family regulator|uniref:LysR family transcriptional regulator n=1 Tax=Arenimonas caeni TaxID=2058085 RepID=A0A2P6MAT2_9GAMM|nr:LysR family transcriptional regulator [Arenimonas caeni]MDY0021422.1 LysR family transcriptional regulator [Arenimonas caeni]PRH83099.1 LysR family transcriptional regulator [Arenimonas caeni]
MNHPDLNDLQFFAMVVEHGGFAAAERALGVPKSRLSRRIAQLESDLGVRLLQRSTRKFAVTDVGQSVYRHAQTMLAEAQAAREAVDRVSAAPRGIIKVSCPVALAQELLAPLLPAFMKKHPQVRIQLHVSNRRVDLIQEGFDVALRVRSQLNDDGEMVARSFGQLRELLVASPRYLDRVGRPKSPADLAGHTTLSMIEDDARQRWTLHGPEGQVQKVDLTPTLMAQDFPLLLAAARDGLGVVLLPELSCAEAIRRGELEVVLPEWNLPQGICHAIYPSRRGLLPAVRAFIDFLAEQLPGKIQDSKLKCGTPGGVPCEKFPAAP